VVLRPSPQILAQGCGEVERQSYSWVRKLLNDYVPFSEPAKNLRDFQYRLKQVRGPAGPVSGGRVA
jgi:hypothetical protein